MIDASGALEIAPPNQRMELTAKSVTPLAGARRAPLCLQLMLVVRRPGHAGER
jgi:hypothetical protein